MATLSADIRDSLEYREILLMEKLNKQIKNMENIMSDAQVKVERIRIKKQKEILDAVDEAKSNIRANNDYINNDNALDDLIEQSCVEIKDSETNIKDLNNQYFRVLNS